MCPAGGVREKNPPVTASPCQPPLGKGAEGTGVRIATGALRPRNDRFYMGCGANGPSGTPAPTEALQEVQGREESPSHGFAVPAPFRQGAEGTGVRIATTSDIGHWFRNDRVTRSAADDRRREGTPPYGGQQGVRGKVGRAVGDAGPYGGGYKGRNGRVVQETGPTKFCVSVFFLAKIF